MVKIAYQAIFNKRVNFREEILTALFEAHAKVYEQISRVEIYNLISINYLRELSNKEFLVGFEVEFDSEKTNSCNAYFRDHLEQNIHIKTIFKYQDDHLYSKLSSIYPEIFKIEMRLREAISVIFLSLFDEDYYDTLKYQKVKPIIGDKSEDRDKRFKNYYQNELFFLTFNQYSNLIIPEMIKMEKLIKILGGTKSRDLKKKILGLEMFSIRKEKYIEFLESIKQDLNSIECMRNCVAHNRDPTEEEEINYDKSKAEIIRKVDDFMINLKKVSQVICSLESKERTLGVYNLYRVEIIGLDGEEIESIDFDKDFFSDDEEEATEEIKSFTLKKIQNRYPELNDTSIFEIDMEYVPDDSDQEDSD